MGKNIKWRTDEEDQPPLERNLVLCIYALRSPSQRLRSGAVQQVNLLQNALRQRKLCATCLVESW